MSMNMTGPLITMMGKFLSVLNQSATIQNNLMCVERSTSLTMIENQATSQEAAGVAQAMATLASGIAGIVGGVIGVAGGVASAVASIGEFAELGNVGKAESVLDMEEMPMIPEEKGDIELDDLSPDEEPVPLETEQNATQTDADSTVQGEDDVIEDNETSVKQSEAAQQKEIEMIKQKWGRLQALNPIGQAVSGLASGMGGAIGYSFTTQEAQANAAATKLGGLAQSVNSMMSGTETNYQNTMSLNTQLANGMFAAFTSWWGASTGR